MGFLDKLARKTTDKAADRAADKIVNKIFGKKEEKYVEDPEPVEQAAPAAVPEVEEPEVKELTPEQQQAIAQAQTASMGAAQDAMGIAYNTKRCPECQAICFNAPATCPYCGADIKSVKPLTPKELEELEG